MKRRREQEMLHNSMEYLAVNYDSIDPTDLAESMCELYDRLEASRKPVVLRGVLGITILLHLGIHFVEFIHKLFWSQGRHILRL